ncbi:MAG: glutaredoxin 3 [Candidatus Paceibacteria bacterium]|jgi:glutaredoxin 3
MDESKKVVIYSTPTCTYCKMAKEFFGANNVEYTEHDVSADDAMRTEMIDKSGQMGVPVIDVSGDIIVGFDEPKLRELLGL